MDIFDFYFASICSLRFHPRNVGLAVSDEAMEAEVAFAARVARAMMRVRVQHVHYISSKEIGDGDDC